MGFSTIVAWMGVFLVLMIATVSLMTIYNTHISDMNEIYAYEKEVGDRHRTNFEFSSTNYVSGNLEAHIKNSGSTTIKLTDERDNKCFDVYIDGEWVNQSVFSTDIMNKTWSPLLWDPEESVNISINKTIDAGAHTLSVIDCGGIKKMDSFSV